jgi:hypothetical protein
LQWAFSEGHHSPSKDTGAIHGSFWDRIVRSGRLSFRHIAADSPPHGGVGGDAIVEPVGRLRARNVYEVEDINIVEAKPGEPFDVLFDPELHAEALAYDAALQAGSDAQPAHVAGLNIQHWVGAEGIEPPTSSL